MDKLYEAAAAFQQLMGKKHIVSLSNGERITIVFHAENFKHLLGLGKLKDIRIFAEKTSAESIFKLIQKGKMNYYFLQQSSHFDAIRDRIDNIPRIAELITSGRVVYDFNPSIVRQRTVVKSDILFFSEEGYGFYLILGASRNKNTYFPRTFFLHNNDAFIKGQEILDIVAHSCEQLIE